MKGETEEMREKLLVEVLDSANPEESAAKNDTNVVDEERGKQSISFSRGANGSSARL